MRNTLISTLRKTAKILLCFSTGCIFISCSKEQPPSPSPPKPFLSIEDGKEIDFGKGTKLWAFSLKGQNAEKIEIKLQVISNGNVMDVSSAKFWNPSPEFTGKIMILQQDNQLFAQDNKKAFRLSASFDACKSSQFSRADFVLPQGFKKSILSHTKNGKINATERIFECYFHKETSKRISSRYKFPDEIESMKEKTQDGNYAIVTAIIDWE